MASGVAGIRACSGSAQPTCSICPAAKELAETHPRNDSANSSMPASTPRSNGSSNVFNGGAARAGWRRQGQQLPKATRL